MSKDLITPARVNDDIVGDFVDSVQQCLDRINSHRHEFRDRPGNMVYHVLREVSVIKDASTAVTKQWAIQWYRVGASRSTIARALGMSWSGIDRWVAELDSLDDEESK